jgi:hypothetical protein
MKSGDSMGEDIDVLPAGEHIGGYEDLRLLDKSGRLDKLEF